MDAAKRADIGVAKRRVLHHTLSLSGRINNTNSTFMSCDSVPNRVWS